MDVSPASLSMFLESLYLNCDAKHFCELRCIHSGTGDVRSHWFSVGDFRSRHFAMNAAFQLNKVGYGVYFTPCLRVFPNRDFGNIGSLSALWLDLDCDNDFGQRNRVWTQLMDFDISPSVIFDSGGGYHVYYFLENVVLSDDDHRRELSFYLAGLSQALGGDDAYAKSLGSLMRLPMSRNTKPGRGGRKVSFEFCFPENRYNLSDFDWLRLEPPKSSASVWANVSVSEAYIPERTRNYLQYGASSGNRNHELFAAACQLRDAGYSQVEAEGLLIGRYVADSLSNENSRQRETEAKSTIRSVYRQARRDPIFIRSFE
jgi:hypothetical protein